jgi:hypothetical protein
LDCGEPVRTLPPDVVVFVLFIGLAAFFIVWDLRKFDLPFQGRQVPATWIARYGAVRSYALYGAFLGAGVITFVPIGAIYVTFGAVALLVGIGSATIAGALYGVARAALVGPAAFVADASSRFLFRSQAAHEITRGSVPYYQ